MSGVRKLAKIAMNLDAWTVAYIGGMVIKPSSAHIQLIDKFVKTTKSILFAKADVFYLGNINNSNDSYRNLIKNAHHGTIQGSGLVWDNLVGFTNPNGTGWVNTNYNPSTQGVKYILNDAGIGINLFENKSSSSKFIIYSYDSANRAGIVSDYYDINGTLNVVNPTLPFKDGFHVIKRTASNVMTYINQNVSNSSNSQISSSSPNALVYLYRYAPTQSSSAYVGGLNGVYIGASLTDAEYVVLNNAINEYLIGCLFLKYGNDDWGVKMAKSYFYDLHGFEKYEAFEVYEFLKRHQPDYVDNSVTGYYYNTFGSNIVANHIMLFKAGGNLLANTWAKTGALLRWSQDGSVANSNTMPAYTRGSKLGIVTVTSADGWDGVTDFSITQTTSSVNSFYGNLPNFVKYLKTSGIKTALNISQNRFKVNFTGWSFQSLISSLTAHNKSYPGNNILYISDIVGGSYTGVFNILGSTLNGVDQKTGSKISGDVTTLTNEFKTYIGIFDDPDIYGSLKNLVLVSTNTTLSFSDTSITEGTSMWNKNISTLLLTRCKLSTAAVDNQLNVINDYFALNTPVKNVTINLSGASMGIPTGGVNNTDLLGIIAKHVSAGFVATINVRTV